MIDFNNKKIISGIVDAGKVVEKYNNKLQFGSQSSQQDKLEYKPFDSFVKSNIGEETANSTPVQSEGFGLKDVFGFVRATTDWLSLPISLGANVIKGASTMKEDEMAPKSETAQSTPMVMTSEALDPKYIINATKEMAKKDIETGGEWSMSQAAKGYLKSRGVDENNPPKISDIVVLGSLGVFHMFGDLVLGVPGAKSLKEFVLWKNVGRLEKPLKEGVSISKAIKSELPISNDLKIKIIPKEKSVIFKGYIKRGSKGEITNLPYEIEGVASEVSKATGKEIIPTVKGNDLILKTTEKAVESLPVSKLTMAGQDILKGTTPNVQQPTTKLDFKSESQPITKEVLPLAGVSKIEPVKQEKVVLPLTKSTETISTQKTGIVEPLEQKAIKYKTADEFIGSKQQVYHATDQEFDTFDPSMNPEEYGTWFTTNKSEISNNKEFPIIKERYIKDDIKLIKQKDLSKLEDTDEYLNYEGDYWDLLMEKGYSGIDFGDGTKLLFDPNKDTLTKSQLTDIWKKANKTTLPKPVKPLEVDPKNFKTAEDYSKLDELFNDPNSSYLFKEKKVLDPFKDILPSKNKPSSVKQILKDGGNPLYHDTDAKGVIGILESGEIKTHQAPFGQLAGQGERVSTTRNFDNYSRYHNSPYRLVIDESKTGQRSIADNREEFESIFKKNIPIKSVKSVAIDSTNPALLTDIKNGRLLNIIETAKKNGVTVELFEGKILPNEFSNKEIQSLTKSQLTDIWTKAQATKPTIETIKPLEPDTLEKSFSKHYEKIKGQYGFDDTGVEFDRKTELTEKEKAYNFIQKNSKKSLRIGYGFDPIPSDINPSIFRASLVASLNASGKKTLAQDIAKIQSSKITEAAQSLVFAKSELGDEISITRNISNERLKKIGEKLGEKKPEQKIAKAKESVTRKTKEVSKRVEKSQASKITLKDIDKLIDDLIC